MTFLKKPSSHAVHAVPSGPVKPRLHTQSVMSSLAISESVLAGQPTHTVPFVTFR